MIYESFERAQTWQSPFMRLIWFHQASVNSLRRLIKLNKNISLLCMNPSQLKLDKESTPKPVDLMNFQVIWIQTECEWE